jgi:hypothetical protein
MVDVEPDRESTPEGFVEEVSDNEATPPQDVEDGYRTKTPKNDPETLPHLRMEQIQARQQELEDARLELELEHDQLERELARHRGNPTPSSLPVTCDGGSPETTMAPPCFARASQNIATAAALLRVLPEHGTPKERQIQETSMRCSTAQQSSRMKARCLDDVG